MFLASVIIDISVVIGVIETSIPRILRGTKVNSESGFGIGKPIERTLRSKKLINIILYIKKRPLQKGPSLIA